MTITFVAREAAGVSQHILHLLYTCIIRAIFLFRQSSFDCNHSKCLFKVPTLFLFIFLAVSAENQTPPLNSTTTTTTPIKTSTTPTPSKTVPVTISSSSTSTSSPTNVPILQTTSKPTESGRKFDGASFVGGIILGIVLAVIFILVYKWWQGKNKSYHSLWAKPRSYWAVSNIMGALWLSVHFLLLFCNVSVDVMEDIWLHFVGSCCNCIINGNFNLYSIVLNSKTHYINLN